jgi:PAS domain S-box-containing protein
MSIDRLARRIDTASAQIIHLRDHVRRSDPDTRAAFASNVARLHDLIDELHASESELRAQQDSFLEAQTALEVERRRYRDLLDLVPVATLLTTRSGVIQRANRAATDLLGVASDQLIGKPLATFVTERPAPMTFFTELSQLKSMAVGTREYVEQLRARSGRAFTALMTVSAVRGQAGEVAGLQWVVRERDATDTRYRSLFDDADDAIVLYDPGRRIVEVNRSGSDLLGYPRHEVGQLRLDDLMVTDAGQLDTVMSSLQGEGVWRGELELRRKDGTIVPVEATIGAVTLPTGVTFRAAFRDVADRRRLHDERERARREVVAMISHELMSPLNGILLHAEILKMTGSYRDRSVDAILTSVQQEQRLIEDLLELSRKDTGRLILRPSRVDLLDMVRCCTASHQSTASNHLLRIDAPARMPPGHWDRTRLEQVCHNLLSNAVKYSPNGGEILVRVEDLGDRAELSVADHGDGIDADALPRIFDRFYRAKSAGADRDGLGLGLYLAKMLVEAHGGTISAESEVGRGSVFRVTLPYAPPTTVSGDDGA